MGQSVCFFPTSEGREEREGRRGCRGDGAKGRVMRRGQREEGEGRKERVEVNNGGIEGKEQKRERER